MKAPIITKRFCVCPECGQGEHQIEHLFETLGSQEIYSAGPWSCDNCGGYFSISVFSDGTIETVSCTEQMGRSQFGLTLLELDTTELLYVVIRDRTYGKVNADDSKHYFYGEHTCTANLIRDAVEVYQGTGPFNTRNLDPHGVFSFRGFHPVPADLSHDEEKETAEKIIRGEWNGV